MKGLCRIALAALFVAACGGDSAITGLDESTSSPPVSGGILALGVDSATGASIETNKDDYAPGEVVHLVGRGWAAGETVNLRMTEAPNTHADVDTNVVADAAGAFDIHFYDVQPHDFGVTFTLTATGQTSGSRAVATFTDGRSVNAVTLNPASPVPASTSIDASVRVLINSGTGAQVWEATKWEVLNSSSVVISSSACLDTDDHALNDSDEFDGNKHEEIVSFTSPATNGSYTLRISLYSTDNCGANSNDPTTGTFPFSVAASNTAPSLSGVPATTQAIPELALYTFDANASDPGAPPQTLTFSLQGTVPAGAAIDGSTGVFTWTPTEAQGPSGPHTFTVRVSDGIANTDQSITINVTEVNVAPSLLGVPASATINELAPYTFDANASDTDVPIQTLTFSLNGNPTGSAIDPTTGEFTWTPSEAQGPGVYTFDVRVGDGVTTTSQSITLTVSESNASPVLTGVPATATIPEMEAYSFDANATDADHPPQTLTFSLVGGPGGATIDGTTGVFNWTPSEGQGPGDYTFMVRVSDGVDQTDASITLTVTEVNRAPVLGAIGNKTVNELALLSFSASATDPDEPANTLTYSLVGAPAGANITTGGAFTWTPTEVQGPGSYTFTVRVSDNGSPNLSDEEEITVQVNEVNVAPVLNSIGNKSGDELTLITFTASANDADIPANSLTYTLEGTVPSGASITTAGVFTWTPTEAQGPGSYSITVRVTDNGTPVMHDEETITVTVNEVNVAPVLGAIGDKEINEGSELTFDANATDADFPANALTFSLAAGAPGGATIDPSTGVFSWTPTDGPTQSQSITIVVTDNGTPALSHSETIDVTVNNVDPVIGATSNAPLAPVPAGPNNVTINWSFDDPGADTWTCQVEWDPGLGFTNATYVPTKGCSATGSLAAGIYTVKIRVNDDDSGTDTESVTAYIVVYDPNGGFVTGGGWINSPAGAYVADPGLTGKANFGFTSKYLPGRNVPTGNTEFQFHAGNLNFKSTVYEWLVVAGDRAQFKGDGTINGVGGYGFLLTAIDGATDKFRIKIVRKSDGSVVYDNQSGYGDDSPAATALSGGSIVIHTKK